MEKRHQDSNSRSLTPELFLSTNVFNLWPKWTNQYKWHNLTSICHIQSLGLPARFSRKSDETVGKRGSVRHRPGIHFWKGPAEPTEGMDTRPCYFLSPSPSLFPLTAASFTKEGKPLKLALVYKVLGAQPHRSNPGPCDGASFCLSQTLGEIRSLQVDLFFPHSTLNFLHLQEVLVKERKILI